MRFLLSRFCLNYFGMLVNTPRMVLHGILNGVILFFLALKWAASTTLLKDFIWLVGWFVCFFPALQIVHIGKVVLMFKNKGRWSVLLKILKGPFIIYIYIQQLVHDNIGSCLLGNNCVCITFVGTT